jgi:hypothetical protein
MLCVSSAQPSPAIERANRVDYLRAEAESLVPWKGDDLHKSRSAAPGWQGAKSELIGHK